MSAALFTNGLRPRCADAGNLLERGRYSCCHIRDIAAGLAAGTAAGFTTYCVLSVLVDTILQNLKLIGWALGILAVVLFFGFLLG